MKTTMQDIANYYNECEDVNTSKLEGMIEEAGFISDCDTEWGICHNDTEKVIIDDNGKAIVTNLKCTMDYKEKSRLGWNIANWLHDHEDFEIELADNIFFGMKIGKDITEEDLREMLTKYENVPFSACDLLKYLNRKNRKELLIEKHSL